MVNALSREEAVELLRRARVGRLGCVVDGEPYVVPVNYYFDGECAYLHSLPGRKITALRACPRACLQVDDIEDGFHWQSVLAIGGYEEVISLEERARVLNEFYRRFPLLTPVETVITQDACHLSAIVFRIRVEKITGLREGLPRLELKGPPASSDILPHV